MRSVKTTVVVAVACVACACGRKSHTENGSSPSPSPRELRVGAGPAEGSTAPADVSQVMLDPGPGTPGYAAGRHDPISLALGTQDGTVTMPSGAKGDGIADDTEAIQAAVNASSLVVLPPGIYRITSAISVPSGVHLLGTLSNVSGSGTWIRQDGDDYHLSLIGTSGAYLQYNEISGITFTGPAGRGIHTAFTEGLSVHDCVFSGGVYGLHMSTGPNEQDVKPRIYRNTFGGQTTAGIWHGDTRLADAWIDDNVFSNIAGYALRIGYLDGGHVARNAVFSELAATIENHGFAIHKPIWARIVDNQLFQVNGHALYVTSPRWSHIERNVAVWTGQTARKEAFKLGSYAGIVANDVSVRGNIAREVYGAGFDATFTTAAADFDFSENRVSTAGHKSTSLVYDAFILNGIARVKMTRNTTDGGAKTRYWLNLQNVVGASFRDNTSQGCVYPGPYLNIGNTGLDFAANGTASAAAARHIAIDEGVVLASAASGGFTLTLPPATVAAAGRRITVIKTDDSANPVALAGQSGQTINGAASFTLDAQWKRVVVIGDGANWVIESSN